MRVPFIDLSRLVARIRGDVLEGWAQCLDTCAFGGGSEVTELEAKLAAALGVPQVVGCSNGTDALLIALQAAGVRRDARVALPNLTFWATFEAIVQLGAVPVLVDVDPDDLQMSLPELRSAHEAYRLDAALFVHLYGWTSSRLFEIRAFCKESSITLVEDGAQCFGARAGTEPVLAGAETATLSFYPSKIVGGAMDGGAVTTQAKARAELARALCDHGRSAHYSHAFVGWNCRMGSVAAVFLSRVLDELPAILEARRGAAAWYRERLAGSGRIKVYGPPPGVVENGYLNVVTVDGQHGDAIVASLASAGIGSARTYPATIDAQPPAKSAGAIVHGDLRWSRRICRDVVNLPLFYGIREDEQEAVVRAFLAAVR